MQVETARGVEQEAEAVAPAQHRERRGGGAIDGEAGAKGKVGLDHHDLVEAEQELVGGVLQDRLVQVGIDPVTGEPQFEPVRVPASMSAGNARGSVRFFAKFGPGGTHQGRLTPAELKLVSEWLDVGAQYFNDPFAAPLD